MLITVEIAKEVFGQEGEVIMTNRGNESFVLQN